MASNVGEKTRLLSKVIPYTPYSDIDGGGNHTTTGYLSSSNSTSTSLANSSSVPSANSSPSDGAGHPSKKIAIQSCPDISPIRAMPRSRWHTLYESPDWWSCWVGFSLLIIILLATITPWGTHSAPERYLPDEWESNPLDAFQDSRTLWGFLGIVIASWLVTPWGFVVMFHSGELARARKEAASLAKKIAEETSKTSNVTSPAPPSSVTTDALVCPSEVPQVAKPSESSAILESADPVSEPTENSATSSPVASKVTSSVSSADSATMVTIIEVDTPKKPSFTTSWRHAFSTFFPRFFLGFTLVIFLSVVAHWLASQAKLRSVGLENALLGLLFGMMISNIYPRAARAPLPAWITAVKAHGETFVKIGLVLLGVDFGTLAKLGLQGLVLSWVCAPLVLIAMYIFGIRVLRMANRKLVMLLSAGTTICGTSAATAVKSAIDASEDDLALTVSILNLFTIIQIVSLPYLAALFLTPRVAGAWFGAAIDATGAVVAAAEIYAGAYNGSLDAHEAVQVAGAIKIVQNAIIGFVAMGCAVYWMRVEDPKEQAALSQASGNVGASKPKKQRFQWIELWDRFPKFVLGFLIVSAVITACMAASAMLPSGAVTAMQRMVNGGSNFWFTIGFVAIGLDTDLLDIARKLKGGKALALYWVGQIMDLAVRLGVAYLCFEIWVK